MSENNESRVAGMWRRTTDRAPVMEEIKKEIDGRMYRLDESPASIDEARQDILVKDLQSGVQVALDRIERYGSKIISLTAANEQLKREREILIDALARKTLEPHYKNPNNELLEKMKLAVAKDAADAMVSIIAPIKESK